MQEPGIMRLWLHLSHLIILHLHVILIFLGFCSTELSFLWISPSQHKQISHKNKLFALNFSATQEIDRIQQAAEAKITALQNENAELKTKNVELENKYTALEARIAALENAWNY